MKKLFYLLFACSFLFISCEEEEDPFSPTSSFRCKIDGEQLSDSAPSAKIITTSSVYNGALEIKGVSNLGAIVMNEVTIIIGNAQNTFKDNFETATDYDISTFGHGTVWRGSDIYITILGSYTGTINFSKITANKVSGTFNFEALNTYNSATQVVVTEGTFTDISY